jgi:NADH-quinone oxidoreductase subunit N
MLSMAGIPPFAGFITKFYIFIAAVRSELYLLAVVGLLISVISTYYYLRIVKIMYFDDKGKVTLPKKYSVENIVIASAVVALNAFLFIIPAKFNDIVFSYVTSLMR